MQDETPCYEMNENGCVFQYTSQVLETEGRDIGLILHIVDGRKEDCPAAKTGIIIGSLLALILLLGLLAMCLYKTFIVISDQRAYAKFEEDRSKMNFATNEMPNDIYKSPVTKFENPMYGQPENES